MSTAPIRRVMVCAMNNRYHSDFYAISKRRTSKQQYHNWLDPLIIKCCCWWLVGFIAPQTICVRHIQTYILSSYGAYAHRHAGRHARMHTRTQMSQNNSGTRLLLGFSSWVARENWLWHCTSFIVLCDILCINKGSLRPLRTQSVTTQCDRL